MKGGRLKEKPTRSETLPGTDRRYRSNADALITECSRIDECQEWADKAAAMASYARQSEDDTLEKMARRIRARAIERCGELLKQIAAAKNQHDAAKNAGGSGTPGKGRLATPARAGLSRDQALAAIRVANVPKEEFEAVVESDDSPTAAGAYMWPRSSAGCGVLVAAGAT
jgi:hypothetical protein